MINSLSELDCSWLAGFIDGEGYIGITFQRKPVTTYQSASARYHPYLIITNTDKKIMDYIEGLLGTGKVYRLSRPTLGRQKVAFQYKLTKLADLKTALTAIIPFMKLKKIQAKLVLTFIECRESANIISGRGTRGVTSYTDEHSLYEQLRILNQRGR